MYDFEKRIAEIINDYDGFDLAAFKTDLYDYINDQVLDVFIDVFRTELSAAREITNYSGIIANLEDTLSEYTDDETLFYKYIFPIAFSGNQIYLKNAVKLDFLGTYSDFTAGKIAAGGSSKGTKESARGWKAIYLRYLNAGKRSGSAPTKEQRKEYRERKKSGAVRGREGTAAVKYEDIMQSRFSFWQANKVAPYWYWYSHPIKTKLACPSQQYKPIETIINLDLEDIIKLVNKFVIEGSTNTEIDFGNWLDDQVGSIQDDPENYEPDNPVIDTRWVGGGGETAEEIVKKIESGEYQLSSKVEERTYESGDKVRITRVFKLVGTRKFFQGGRRETRISRGSRK